MLLLMYLCLFAEIVLLPFLIKSGFPGLTVRSFILKIACSVLFIVYALAAAFRGGRADSYFALVFSGLLCGFAGDVLLAIEPVIKNRKKLLSALTVLGGVFFLAGHVLFIVAFARQMKLRSIPLGAGFVVSFGVVFAAVVALKFILKIKTGKLTVPVLVYTLMITAMFALAFTLGAGTHHIVVAGLLTAGALCFVASDLNLALKVFDGDRFCTLSNRCLYVDLYYAAQLLIATTLLFL